MTSEAFSEVYFHPACVSVSRYYIADELVEFWTISMMFHGRITMTLVHQDFVISTEMVAVCMLSLRCLTIKKKKIVVLFPVDAAY